jgi:cholesterol transport system auxiliary component
MLGPVLVNALSASGRFRAVMGGPANVSGDLRLDIEIVSLQQEFDTTPSHARVSLRAQLIDLENRDVLATRTFEAVQAAPSEDPYGGVVAINQALEQLLDQLVRFCASRGAAESTTP